MEFRARPNRSSSRRTSTTGRSSPRRRPRRRTPRGRSASIHKPCCARSTSGSCRSR
jgi:hypothetical protein